MKSMNFIGFFLFIVTALLTSSIWMVPVNAHSGDVFEAYTEIPPIIDGVINEDTEEWRDATAITFDIPEGDATIYVMNDRRFLYIAAKVSDNSLDEIVNVGLDIFTIDFDVRHDGTQFNVGEDTISIGARNRVGDAFVGPALDILDDAQIDVDGMVGRIGNYNHFEIVHPLDSGDANDIAAAYGSTIGARFILFDDSGSEQRTITVYPKEVSAQDSDQSNWADIVIVAPPDGGTSSSGDSNLPITEIGIVVVAVGWAAYIGWMLRKRRS